MKGKDKEKATKSGNKDDVILINEMASRKEIGAQDNPCTSVMQGEKKPEAITTVLEKLVGAVDNVTGKLGGIESRLNVLETDVRSPKTMSQEPLEQWYMGDELLFNTAGGARPKQRRVKQIMSDVEIVDSDSDGKSRKKKKAEKKGPVPARLNQCTDKTTVERRSRYTETGATAQGLLPQAGASGISQGIPGQGVDNGQGWAFEQTAETILPKQFTETQRDLLEFLKPNENAQTGDATLPWPELTQNLGNSQEEENYKDDVRLQTLVWERLQHLENEAKQDGTQGKRKRSGRYNVTDKVKVGVLRPVQQPGSYWDRSSELPLVGLEPTEVTAYD